MGTSLRTLTKKSIMWFGKYNNLSIQQILDLKELGYLRFIYYNYSGISFNDEILTTIGVFEEYRIQKPGKNIELHKTIGDHRMKIFCANSINNGNIIPYVTAKNYVKRKKKAQYVGFKKTDSIRFSKSSLQRLNHGH
jgi:hypothetical protein